MARVIWADRNAPPRDFRPGQADLAPRWGPKHLARLNWSDQTAPPDISWPGQAELALGEPVGLATLNWADRTGPPKEFHGLANLC